MGCVCHLANICAPKAVKCLPVPVEDLLIDVYFHFYHGSKRKEQLKEFQNFTDTEPMKLLKHCSTRWLSLEKCVSRFPQKWPALKSYFTSHDDCESGGWVQCCTTWLSDEGMWLNYAFLEFVLPILNEFNTTFQAGESMIGLLDIEMNCLLRKLLGRFVKTAVISSVPDITKVKFTDPVNQHDNELIAIGWRARQYISETETDPDITKHFYSSVRDFYCTVVRVMIAKFPFEDPSLRAMAFLNPATKDKVTLYEVEQLGVRFLGDSRESLNQIEEEAHSYITTPLNELPSAEEGLEDFWNLMQNMKTALGKYQ